MGSNRYANKIPPVLLITFNRPELTARMLDRIKAAGPEVLYVACDGPRPGREDDVANIRRIHELVVAIDWCKEVKTRFQPSNLGCGRGESEAMSWLLNDAGEGIILEDDTLPDLSFFHFCGEMLDRYRDVTQVMQISGYNYLSGRHATESDYFFSKCGFSWGWASWQRAWKYYDFEMKSWPEFKRLGHHRTFPFTPEDNKFFDLAHKGGVDTWDYQWNFVRGANSGLSVVPKFSLIENIGFGVNGAHGVSLAAGRRYIAPVRPMPDAIKHPQFIFADDDYDQMLVKVVYKRGFKSRLKRLAGGMLGRAGLR